MKEYTDRFAQPTYVLMQNGLNVEVDLYEALKDLKGKEPSVISTAVWIGTNLKAPNVVEHNDFVGSPFMVPNLSHLRFFIGSSHLGRLPSQELHNY